MRTTARCVGVMLLVSSLYRTNHALLYFVMSLHPVMNDEVLLPKGINSFLIFPFTILSAQESKSCGDNHTFLKEPGKRKRSEDRLNAALNGIAFAFHKSIADRVGVRRFGMPIRIKNRLDTVRISRRAAAGIILRCRIAACICRNFGWRC